MPEILPARGENTSMGRKKGGNVPGESVVFAYACQGPWRTVIILTEDCP